MPDLLGIPETRLPVDPADAALKYRVTPLDAARTCPASRVEISHPDIAALRSDTPRPSTPSSSTSRFAPSPSIRSRGSSSTHARSSSTDPGRASRSARPPTPNHVEMGASRSIRIDAPLTTPGTPRSTPRP